MTALSRDYGLSFVVYWTGLWAVTGVATYAGIVYGEVDVISYIRLFDEYAGWSLAERIDPRLGDIAVAVAVNEMMEPVRLPFVVMTTPYVVGLFKKK